MVKFQPVRAQCRLLPIFSHAILAVSHKRHAGMCHLQSYLVVASGVELYVHADKLILHIYDGVFKLSFLDVFVLFHPGSIRLLR